MIQTCLPEDVGIASGHVSAFYRELAKQNLSTHSVIMARGYSIFSECYYDPFHADYLHRMYSISKSFVSVAIGFCEQDGLLSLDDSLSRFFPEYTSSLILQDDTQTVRDMLRMETVVEGCIDWFHTNCDNRNSIYFSSNRHKYPGTQFCYDSPGSYLLGVIVERITGKDLLAYLREKILDLIGFSKEAYFLRVPGKHSFGDSGLMCTARDLLLFARFVLNMGSWGGTSYLNAEYLRQATTPTVCSSDYGFLAPENYGYGYQFWGASGGCFAMLGMGDQIALCDPKHDFIFVINSDNQGHSCPYQAILSALYQHIIPNFDKGCCLVDQEEQQRLLAYTSSQKLFSLPGKEMSSFSSEIHNRLFICDKNPMSIRWFLLRFTNESIEFRYENQQGEKSFSCGLGHNLFGKFPQVGYPDKIATIPCAGHCYEAAFSADWVEKQKLRMRIQIIDKYFGNLSIVFGFRDRNRVTVRMKKSAEAFLEEYEGILNAVSDISNKPPV